MLGQSPGIRRPLLLAPARGFGVDAEHLASTLGALRDVPWLAPSDLDTLIASAAGLTPRAAASTRPLPLYTSEAADDRPCFGLGGRRTPKN